MAAKDERRAELDALAAGLAGGSTAGARNGSAPAESAAAAPRSERAPNFDSIIHDLEETLAAAAEDAEHIVASHPLAALALAFTLGLVIGRISRRG